MENELLIAILAGLGGMLGWGLADFFAKKAIDLVGDLVSLAWGHIFGSVVLILIFLYQYSETGQGLALPSDFRIWAALILFGIAQAAVYLFVYMGFRKGQLAVLSPIFATFAGITAVLSVVIFGEFLAPITALGLVVMFIGIIVISTDLSAIRSMKVGLLEIKGFKEIAIATLMAAVWTLLWGRYLGGEDWLSYTAIMYISMAVATVVWAYFTNVSLKINSTSAWIPLILIGVCEVLAYIAISIGYSLSSALSVVAVLSSAFSLPAIILAFIFLKERITKSQIIGAVIIIAGIMTLSII